MRQLMKMESTTPDLRQYRVSVCIPTCRRPQLLRATLASIATQRFERDQAPRIEVLVADNDEAGAGLDVVSELSADFPWPLRGLREPIRGISFARNTLVAAASESSYVAFIDDDETADPHWLQELLKAAVRSGAQATLGPVSAQFEATPPAWLRPFFDDLDLPDGAQLPEGSFRTSNVLLEMNTLAAIPGPFDPAFALTGGSDYMLGQELRARGGRFVWARNAVVSETVPASRTTLRWYMQRRFRTGMTFAMAQRRVQGPLRGALRGAYRGAGSLAVGSLGLVQGVVGSRAQLAEAAGLVAYGVGNLAGATGEHYEEYRTVHGR